MSKSSNRARSRAIRARMAATGVPYSVAARAVDQAAEPAPGRKATGMPTTIQLPSHYVRTDDERVLPVWECACGVVGHELDDAPVRSQAAAHQREEAREILRELNVEQLVELLRRGAVNDWRATAAVELLIRHEVWLHDETMREDYLDIVWTFDGDASVRVQWWAVGETAGLVRAALRALDSAGMTDEDLDEIQQWDNGGSTGRAPLDGSESEMTILRVAASIASDLPIRLHEDTLSLDNTNRGLVLTAIGHLLTHGGGVPTQSATTWSKLPWRRRPDYC